MHKPERYNILHHSLAQITKRILNKYWNEVKWTKNKLARILDIGSGPGETTRNVLYPLCEDNLETIIGIDVSVEMVDFANNNFSNSKLMFLNWDISNEEKTNTYRNYFDYVVSFWCLNWISNQEKAFSNIWNTIKPGGSMLVTIASSSNIFDVYSKVRSNANWISYLDNKDHAISIYNNSQNPCMELTKLLQKIGFEVDICELDDGVLKFDENDFREYLIICHPFYETLPDDLKENFINEHKVEMQNCNFVEYNNDNDCIYVVNFKIVVVYAKKKL